MANLFLSYDRDDADKAQAVAGALEKAGHYVWWDRHIRGGAEYSEEIEQALDRADAVIVLWSKASVKSPWVRDEAAAGRDSGRLVPVLVEPISPPMGFRQYQSIDLAQWSPKRRSAQFEALLKATQQLSDPQPEDTVQTQPAKQSQGRSIRASWLAAAAVITLLVVGLGAWNWFRASALPVIEVTAGDDSPRSRAAANDLFVKLGTLAQVGQGRWQLIDSTGESIKSDLLFRIADTSRDNMPQSNLVLLDGKKNALLWSREFSFPVGRQADLRQVESLTAGRVLGCALESRDQGGLSADLLKIFLDVCASLADLSGEGYGPVIAQLRRIVDRAPDFEPAWRRLIMAESTAIEFGRYTGGSGPLEQQFRADIKEVRSKFPNLPELAIAELRLNEKVDYGRDIDSLSAAAERSPDNPELLAELSVALQNVGRMDDAIGKARRASELDPLSPGGTTSYIMALAHGGQIEAARSELAKAKKLWAGTGSLRDAQLAFFVRYGDPATAIKLDSEGYNSAFYYNARTDPSPANIAKLKAGIDEFRDKPVSAGQVGWAVQGLAEFQLVDDVYYWLGRLSDNDLAKNSYIFFRPALGSVRRDPRFMPMMKRIGLVDYWQKSGMWPDFCGRPGIPFDCKTEAAKLG